MRYAWDADRPVPDFHRRESRDIRMAGPCRYRPFAHAMSQQVVDDMRGAKCCGKPGSWKKPLHLANIAIGFYFPFRSAASSEWRAVA